MATHLLGENDDVTVKFCSSRTKASPKCPRGLKNLYLSGLFKTVCIDGLRNLEDGEI